MGITISYIILWRRDHADIFYVIGKIRPLAHSLLTFEQRNIGHMDVTGTVLLNDCPIRSEMTSMSAYIQQEDLFVGTLTVREHLTFQVSDLKC